MAENGTAESKLISPTTSFMTKERERLQKAREGVMSQRAMLDKELGEIDRALSGFDAFEAAVSGKSAASATERKRKGPAPGTPRAPRGSGASAREKVLALIREHPEGIASKDVEDQLSDIKNVANVLSSLKKEGLITQSARRQPWFPAAA